MGGSVAGNALYHNEAFMRLEQRRDIQRRKSAVDRQHLLIQHSSKTDNESSSSNDGERQLLQGCNLLNKEDIGFMMLMKDKKVTFAYMQSFISMYLICFFGGFLAIKLEDIGVRQ